MNLRSSLTVEVDLSPARLVNELNRQGIPTRAVVKKEGCTRFTVDKTYSRKTFAFFDEMCYTYKVVSSGGALERCKRSLWRLGAVVGLLAFFGLYVYLGGFIWRVEVSGQEYLSAKTIAERAAALGAGRGVRANRIDPAALETALRAGDGILECSVEIRGVTLKISVMEDTRYHAPEEEGRADIVSEYDAEVTRVVCERGTPRVKAGDRIAAGAVLIEGASYSTMGDDYGNPILLEEYRARGTVYGKTVLAKSIVIPETSVRLTRTGAVKRKTVLSLWGMRIGKVDSPFELYETERRVKRLEPIPLAVETVRFYEVCAQSVEADPDARIAELTAELESQAELKGGTAGNVTHTVRHENGMYTVSVYVEAEIILGKL